MKSHHRSFLRPLTRTLVRFRRILAGVFVSLLVAGCGQTGAPLAPSLQLPEAVSDLTATRVANKVRLHWTMPHRTTDKLLLKGPQPVHICRHLADGPCVNAADVTFPPEKPVTYEDTLPPDLATGAPQLLTYSVDVLSRHARSAGSSNFAYTAAGLTPPPFTDAHGQIEADGVVLQWQPANLSGDANKVNIVRTLLSAAAKPDANSKSSPGGTAEPPIKVQTLTVHLPAGADPGKALDPDAAFDQRYSYAITRVATVTVGGKSIDVQGPPSSGIVVDTRDTFPPGPPTGLVAVAAPREGAIDLSWTPNTEKDLAGYAVYRSEANGKPARISDAVKPIDSAAFRDSTAKSGVEYTYFVTAIDRDGNESGHSSEAAETLPPKP